MHSLDAAVGVEGKADNLHVPARKKNILFEDFFVSFSTGTNTCKNESKKSLFESNTRAPHGQGSTRTRKKGKGCSCSIRQYWKFKVMPRV